MADGLNPAAVDGCDGKLRYGDGASPEGGGVTTLFGGAAG
jgi:hypothetical protein